MASSSSAADRAADRAANRTIGKTIGSWLLTFGLVVLVIMVMGGGPLTQGQAIAFETRTLAGESAQVGAGLNRPTLLYVWATWCTACKLTTGTVEGFAERNPAVQVLALSPEAPAVITAWNQERQTPLALVAGAGSIIEALGIRAFPTTVMIGRDGRVLWNRQGVLLPGELDIRQ